MNKQELRKKVIREKTKSNQKEKKVQLANIMNKSSFNYSIAINISIELITGIGVRSILRD